MKVICAGFQKTGTKSLSRALEQLGYKVYDASETYVYMRQTWIDFFAGKITIEDVCGRYDEEGVDVIVDGPGNYFWKEMAEYWPKAKIILTVRDNEDKWYSSLIQFYSGNIKWLGKLVYFGYLSPYGVKTEFGLTIPYHRIMFGNSNFHPLTQDFGNINNEATYKRKYREHNLVVRTCAPRDRLLDFNVKEGWKVLCEFLDEPVPDTPFPFRNKSGKPGQTEAFLDEIMKPHIRKCKIEVRSYQSSNSI
jgi:hypothetical protein